MIQAHLKCVTMCMLWNTSIQLVLLDLTESEGSLFQFAMITTPQRAHNTHTQNIVSTLELLRAGTKAQ